MTAPREEAAAVGYLSPSACCGCGCVGVNETVAGLEEWDGSTKGGKRRH